MARQVRPILAKPDALYGAINTAEVIRSKNADSIRAREKQTFSPPEAGYIFASVLPLATQRLLFLLPARAGPYIKHSPAVEAGRATNVGLGSVSFTEKEC